MSSIPDLQTLYFWLLRQFGVPGVVLAGLATLLAVLSYVGGARKVGSWLHTAGQTLRARLAKAVGVRASTIVTAVFSGLAIPVSVVALVKLGAMTYSYGVLYPRDATFHALVFYSLTTDPSANAILSQVGLWTAVFELLFVFATFAKIGIVHTLLFLVGALMLGAMWLMRILFGFMALVYVALTYFHVEGASLDIAGLSAIVFGVAVVGFWAVESFADAVDE